MKLKLIKLFAILAVGALALSSCELSTDTSKSGSASDKGTVTISIPRVNPYIVASQGSVSKGAPSKAFAYVDAIEVDLYQGGAFVQAVNLGSTSYDEATNTITGSISVLAGTYDRLIVSVFNNAVSSTEVVVAGQTEEAFKVPAGGSVDLSIVLYPSDPVSLVKEEYSAQTKLSQYGEKWYSFEAPGTIATVTLKTDSGDLDAYIFGPDGKPLSGISGSGAEESAQFETTAYDMYYVCLISPKETSTGEVKYENSSGTVGITFY
jgi:hypothetical protein